MRMASLMPKIVPTKSASFAAIFLLQHLLLLYFCFSSGNVSGVETPAHQANISILLHPLLCCLRNLAL